MDKKLDKLSSADEKARIELLRQVQERVALGVPISRACREAGYPRSSYYVDLQKLDSPTPPEAA